MKNTMSWVFGIFLLLAGISYINTETALSIIMCVLGFILLPPINKKIIAKMGESNIKKYKDYRNIFIIIYVLVFSYYVPSNSMPEKSNTTKAIPTSIEESIDGSSFTGTDNINQETIDKSVTNILSDKNGKYTGDIVDGVKQGQGEFLWNDGTKYTGTFDDNNINGQGTLIYSNGESYEGNFVNGIREGNGTFKFSNGDVYTGNWKDDKMAGQGDYKFSNGDEYKGEFSENAFNGKGSYIKDGVTYTGSWVNNSYQK